jgi:capsular exopolysaccharide synthesis family protein
MSEIFNWLKQTEFDRRKSPIEASVSSVILLPADDKGREEDRVPFSGTSSDIHNIMETSPPAEEPALPKFEIHSVASLNLDLADYRIKSALDPTGLVGEQFRLLRASLARAQKQRNIKSLLITSAAPGEGKTFVACSLAGVLAQEPGKRVLLIDADLRRSHAAKDLGANGHGEVRGLSDVLRGNAQAADVLISTPNSSLFLLPAGAAPENPAELLSSNLLPYTLRILGERFDWIVVDSPPVIALADPIVLAPLCDTALLVVRSNKTPSNQVKDCVQRLGREKFCGVVMNRSRNIKFSKSYYSYYNHESSRQ